MKTQGSVLKNILFSCITIVLLLFLLEGVVRFFFSDYILKNQTTSCLISACENGLMKKKMIDGVEYYYSEILPVKYYVDAKYSDDSYLRVKKTSDVYRVLIFGGSSAAGSPFGNWGSFSRFLLDGLRILIKPLKRVEVFNCSISSGTSSTALDLLSKLIFLQPDMIILYCGHNEGVDGMQGDLTVEHWREASGNNHGYMLQGLSDVLYDYFYTYRLFRIFLSGNVRPIKYSLFDEHPNPHSIKALVHEKKALHVIEKRFEKNIDKIINVATKIKCDVLLVGQISNLFISPVDFSGQPTWIKKSIDSLSKLYEEKKYRKTISHAQGILKHDSRNPVAFYYMGLAYLALGKKIDAEKNLQLAVEFDRYPRRYRPITYTRLLESKADQYENVYFVNIDEDIGQLIEDRLVDGRLIMDVMHPMIELNKFIAIKIMEQHFIKSRYRTAFFKYDQYNRANMLGRIKEEKYYRLICNRYFGMKDWRKCIELQLENRRRNKQTENIEEMHKGKRIWEYLFYYGRVTGDNAAIKKAISIFMPWTIIYGGNEEIH